MQLTDPRWSEKWSKVAFPPPLADYSAAIRKRSETRGFWLFGTDDEPGSSVWLATLSEAMGSSFREGMTVLDYGCGAGRYARFLAERLAHFTYYGLEKRGSAVRHGEKSIEAARELHGWDSRAAFDLIGSALEATAIASAEVVLLGSVFTHIDLAEVTHILQKVQPIVARDGKIVFSIFLADVPAVEGPGIYGFDGCYNRTWFTAQQMRRLCDDGGWKLGERDTFVAQDQNVHHIFTLEAKTRRHAFVAAGVEFLDENGGGPGVRLRKRQQKKG